MTISQADLEQRVLSGLYDFIQQKTGLLSPKEVAGVLDNEFTEARVQMALRALERDNLVRGSHNAYSGSSYEISEKGYKQIETAQGTNDNSQAVETTSSAPGSDRVVSFDHNSAPFRRVIVATRDLSKQLLESNDLGELSTIEAGVAAHEVGQIADSLENEFVRPAGIWVRAQSTLGWIGREAASAMVGAAALALLALLATLLGFSL